jgi:dethiobiotin synthetase
MTGDAPGLIIAAPASGSGKTVVSLGILRALAGRGIRVAAAKAGPDYIDAAFHAAASGRPCVNLDPWAMRPLTLARLIAALSHDADIVLCEGVMGLFDGVVADGRADVGSTADLAALTGWPVILVVDARHQSASVAALVRGFASHRSDVQVAGVIFNRVGSARHAEALRLRWRCCRRCRCWAAWDATNVWRCPSAIWAWCRPRSTARWTPSWSPPHRWSPGRWISTGYARWHGRSVRCRRRRRHAATSSHLWGSA